ncbi:MAG: hypothetical protein OQK04_00785, partial [Kangiellaceae bacterium]|nr:hypothetical protein [Kangiellaceae bacterium]
LKTHQTIARKVENNQQIYTLVPKKLNKTDLKSGEEFDVKIDVFKGQFDNAGKRILESTDASMRSLFYRQIHKAKKDKKKKYSKFEKYYAIQSGKKTFLFNRVTDYRPFEHVVIANNQCAMKNKSLEVRMLKSKSQPTYSGSLESLKAIADKYDLNDLRTIYLNKKKKSW